MDAPSLSLRAAVRLPWARFQLPPRQSQHAAFRHWAFLLASPQGLWDRSSRECFRQVAPPTPPVPAEPQSPGKPSPWDKVSSSGPATGRLYHPVLTSRVVGDSPTAGRLRSAGITPPPRYYTPIRHPLAFDPLPGVAGYRAYLAPVISHRGEEGFSSCSARPCHRAAAITPPKWNGRLNQFSVVHAAFTPGLRVRPSETGTLEATSAFYGLFAVMRWRRPIALRNRAGPQFDSA